ncbi:DegT/DnrJ/EryC1/StrS family aminotransferase [Collimonas fungivorans]|uniref:Putative aminotransferase n=1 Tax=Collimonas fungivorans (strain Ter331) TaxID=1005048 RepID=G0AAB6_COLFT|nr:DegT/DnrJ/EryC1/StrS family aminotransferase [Collimonas fungivorans]AEK63130.1 putative aminotransferase [Collimonas fungivorans Ter331]
MNIASAKIVMPAEDIDEITRNIRLILESGRLILGPYTEAFEHALSSMHGGAHAIAVSNGTGALEIILRALGVQGRQVVVPANTFFATAAAALHAGATLRFADVGAQTMMLTLASVERAVTADTAAVVMVHIGGAISPELDAIKAFCEARGIYLAEDAAHALGSTYQGRAAGTLGAAGSFSFYPTKIVTCGEGGAIITHDAAIAREAVIHRDQGKQAFSENCHIRLGYNWRLSEIHAAVGLVQLRRLQQFITAKRAVAARYDQRIAVLDGVTPVPEGAGVRSNYHKYVVLLDAGCDRAMLRSMMQETAGIQLGTGVYDVPLHLQPVFSGMDNTGLQVAEDVCARHVCLPIHSDMTFADADRVITALAACLARLRKTAAPLVHEGDLQ